MYFGQWPLAHRIGVGAVTALLCGMFLVVARGPGAGSQHVKPLPPVNVTPSAADGTGPVPAAAAAPAPVAAPARAAATPATAAPVTSPSVPADPNVHGLRPATPAELAAVAAGVVPPAGDRIDGVQIAESDPTWGVAHAGGSNPQWLLLSSYAGRWGEAEYGYPTLPCYVVPGGVAVDLGNLLDGCPP